MTMLAPSGLVEDLEEDAATDRLQWPMVRLGLELSGQLTMRNGFPCGNNNDEGRGIAQLRPINVSSDGQIELSAVKYIEPGRDVSGYALRPDDVISITQIAKSS